jgi:hypothetical protein
MIKLENVFDLFVEDLLHEFFICHIIFRVLRRIFYPLVFDLLLDNRPRDALDSKRLDRVLN